MTFSPNFWGGMSILMTTVQYIPYFKGIHSGRVKPHAFSWLVWALPAGITFFAQLAKHTGPGAWATGYTTILCCVVFALSLSHGEKKIVLLDWITLGCAMLAIILWAVTDDPLGAVILATIANTLGFIPTVRKSIDKPFQEPLTSYGISISKWLCAIAGMQTLTLTTLMFPVASMVCGAIFIVWVTRRRKIIRAQGLGT